MGAGSADERVPNRGGDRRHLRRHHVRLGSAASDGLHTGVTVSPARRQTRSLQLRAIFPCPTHGDSRSWNGATLGPLMQRRGMTEESVTRSRREVVLVPSNVWRIGLVVLAVIALGLVLRFFIQDSGSVIFTVLMSWCAAIAMAPVVDRLSRRMRRDAATILLMLGFAVFMVIFVVAFGSLLV